MVFDINKDASREPFLDIELGLDTEGNSQASFFLTRDNYERWNNLQASGTLTVSKTLSSIVNTEEISLPFVVTSVSFRHEEFQKLMPHLGDTFSLYFYGKSPVIMQISGYLLDDLNNNGKSKLVDLYNTLFKISAIARSGIVPSFGFLRSGAAVGGLTMNLSETSSMEDVLQVSMSFIVFDLYFEGGLESGSVSATDINYTSSQLIKETDFVQ